MKKILSIVCILMLCLPAVAQKKSSSKSSSKSSVAASSYSGGSARKASSSLEPHHRNQVGITADIGYWGQVGIVTRDVAGQTQTTTTVDPNGQGIDFSFSVGANWFAIKNLEIGLSLGYASTKWYMGVDANNDDLYRVQSLFNFTPQVAYHIPLCGWLDYVPAFYTSFGFGSRKTEQNINPYQTLTQRSTRIIVGLDIVNFEIRPNKNMGLMLNVGGLYYNTSIQVGGGANNRNIAITNTTSLSLFGNASIGFRYYFN